MNKAQASPVLVVVPAMIEARGRPQQGQGSHQVRRESPDELLLKRCDQQVTEEVWALGGSTSPEGGGGGNSRDSHQQPFAGVRPGPALRLDLLCAASTSALLSLSFSLCKIVAFVCVLATLCLVVKRKQGWTVSWEGWTPVSSSGTVHVWAAFPARPAAAVPCGAVPSWQPGTQMIHASCARGQPWGPTVQPRRFHSALVAQG